MSSLIVFNLPKTITKNDLRETFGQKGNVTNVQLVFTVDNEYCYFALITYENEKDAEAAFNHFNRAHLFSSRIMVERCSEIGDKTKTENCTYQNAKSSKQKTGSNDKKLSENAESTKPLQSSSNYLANLPYEEGQWSANNPTRKKVYSKSFLIELGSEPVCQKKHEKLNFKDPFVKSMNYSTYSLVSSQIVQDFNENPMNALCESIIQEYELTHNFDVITFALVKDTKSVFYNNPNKFVKFMSLVTLSKSSSSREEVGKMFADLFSTKIISITALINGMNVIFKDWAKYLVTYPEFFSHLADIIAPLLISTNFEFSHLKDIFKVLNSNTASANIFIEVLRKILNAKEIQQQGEGIVRIYKKWKKSEITLDAFVLNNQIKKYFTNDQLGVFMLSIAMYDKMMTSDCKQFDDIMTKWITDTIKQEIIQYPQLIRALAIAISFMGSFKSNKIVPFNKKCVENCLKLLSSYICFNKDPPLKKIEILTREVECLYGIQIACAVVNYDKTMLSSMFCLLLNNKIISRYSFYEWKSENKFKSGFDEDLQIKDKAISLSHSFFTQLIKHNSDKNK